MLAQGRECPLGTEWDDMLKQCVFGSKTCQYAMIRTTTTTPEESESDEK